MKTKIQNRKVVFEKGGRIICNGHRMTVEELANIVEIYINNIYSLKRLPHIKIDQEKLNFGIRFNLFGIDCTVGNMFKLYNEVAVIEGFPTYSKIWYNPMKSGKLIME